MTESISLSSQLVAQWMPLWPWLVLIAGVFLLAKLSGAARRRLQAFPYRAADALFTPAERAFLRALDQAVGADYRVFGKVRIADVIALKEGLPPATRRTALNRIAAKHLDYVICRADTLSVVCAIELNDRSHNHPSRRARDEFVTKVCQKARVPLLMVPAQRHYSVAELQARFRAALSGA